MPATRREVLKGEGYEFEAHPFLRGLRGPYALRG